MVEAAFIGVTMSFVAPLCNAAYCDFVLKMPFFTIIGELLTGMVPLAIVFVILAIVCSVLVPQSLSRFLSQYQIAIPFVVTSLLYSVYFTMLGFGMVSGGIFIFGRFVTYYSLSPALIAGLGALLHIIVRPRNHSTQQKLDDEIS